MGWILSLLGLIGSGVSSIIDGIFKVKQMKIEQTTTAMLQYYLKLRQEGILDQLTLTTGSQILLAEMQSEHWLLACWRPLIAVTYCGTWLVMLGFAYFGIMPPPMNDTMLAVFGATNSFVLGYGLLRTNEKNKKIEVVRQIVNNIAAGNTTSNGIIKQMPKEGYGKSSPNFDTTNPNLNNDK